jgi:hypothetical protein
LLELNDVTLIAVDCVNLLRLYNPLKYCTDKIKYNSVKIITHKQECNYLKDKFNQDIEFVFIPKIKSIEEYSYFIIKELNKYFSTSHCLIFQNDGWVVNPNAWTNEFLEYDYIGAPWYWLRNIAIRSDHKEYNGNIVGNGGFSLRSKKLCDILANSKEIENTHPEDGQICTVYDKFLESKGIKFASEELAAKFSVENCEIYSGQFGHHNGIFQKII